MRTFLAVIALFVAVAARAQEPAPAAGGGCVTRKLKELCPDAKLGSPEFAACAQKKLADADASCHQSVSGGTAAIPDKFFDPNNPCQEDIQRICHGGAVGKPATDACLKAHKKELMPACAAAGHPKIEAKDGKDEAACAVDAQKLCPDLPADDSKAFAECLERNSEKLSPACRKARRAPKAKPSAAAVEKQAEKPADGEGR